MSSRGRGKSDLVAALIGLAVLLGLRYYREALWLFNIEVPWKLAIMVGGIIVAALLLWRKSEIFRVLVKGKPRRGRTSIVSDKGAIIAPDGGRYRAYMAFTASSDGGGEKFLESLDRAGIPFLYLYASPNAAEHGGGNSLILLCSKPSKDVFRCLEEVEHLARQVEALASAMDENVQLSLVRLGGIDDLLNLWRIREVHGQNSGERSLLRPKIKPRCYLGNLDETLLLGRVSFGGKTGHSVFLPKREILRHTAIFGATGSGKTTTAATILVKLLEKGVNVLVIDWHGEYCELVKKVGGDIFTPGGEEHPIVLNPFELIQGADVEESLDLFVDFFSDLFHLSHAQVFMLKEAVRNAYESALARGSPPTLADVIQEVGMIPIRSGWDHETKMALLRRLKKLTEGKAGKALNGPSTADLHQLFSGFKVVDLSNLGDLTVRSVVAATILKLAYDYFTALGGSEDLRQVIVVEEASNIMPPRRREDPPGVGERVLMELRKYGVGMIILAQSPAAVSSEVLKNTSIKIVHALRSSEDLRALPSLMLAEDEIKQRVLKLSPGEALVVSPSYPEPVVVRIEPPEVIWEGSPKRNGLTAFSELTRLASLLDQA